MRCGASKKIKVRASVANFSNCLCLALAFADKNPSNTNRSVGNPLAESAVIIEQGPGIGTT